jgi:DNA-binding PadR family transcriptional regulator
VNIINLSVIKKVFDSKHNSIEQTLKELQTKGYVNSQGEYSVDNAIINTIGYSIEYFHIKKINSTKCLQIGLKEQSGRAEKILTISEEGKLYLSNN